MDLFSVCNEVAEISWSKLESFRRHGIFWKAIWEEVYKDQLAFLNEDIHILIPHGAIL